MQRFKTHTLFGWGRTPSYICKSWRAEQICHIAERLQQTDDTLIARGCGRSYGDASLQPNGVMHLHRMDKILSYDKKAGIITAQSGVTLQDIMQLCLSDGWMLPVLSGTQHVSLGGALASNIHGKNQYHTGNIANHISHCSIMLADENVVSCSPSQHSELFYATAGGMGMTGIIIDVTLQLKRISSAQLNVDTKKVASLEDMLECFEVSKHHYEYMVGWIDHFATGNNLGRGVFERANHVDKNYNNTPLTVAKQKKPITIPDIIPSFVLNRYSMALYNKIRFNTYDTQWRQETTGFERFFHPLDNLNHWNRLYGKRGFYQYQCIVPENSDTLKNILLLLRTIQQRKCFSYLAVIKYHKSHRSMFSFDMNGYSIALDFPNTQQSVALQSELNHIVADIGGRIYLAKDALLERKAFEKMYADQLPQWKETLSHIDPQARFTSLMSQRLGFKDYTS